MGKNGIIIRIAITVLFLISLYFVEAGFCGSSVVAKYNNGFGTLDMKSYNVSMVETALAPMNEEGIMTYKLYYVMDYIFILFFGAFQIMLINDIYHFQKSRIITIIIFGVPILRGICDMIENTILLWTLNTYPKINETAIFISSGFTAAKLICIRIWSVLLVLGLIWKVVLHFIKVK